MAWACGHVSLDEITSCLVTGEEDGRRTTQLLSRSIGRDISQASGVRGGAVALYAGIDSQIDQNVEGGRRK